jgi:hypothetical protein
MKRNQKELPKQRNPFVQHLINRGGTGVHQKPKKTERQQGKIKLRKEWLDQVAA